MCSQTSFGVVLAFRHVGDPRNVDIYSGVVTRTVE